MHSPSRRRTRACRRRRRSWCTCGRARSTAALPASRSTRRSCRSPASAAERIFAVGAWRESPRFSDAERAALALTEAATRLSDRSDPVPDEVWEQAAEHYDEQALAALVIEIASINAWNRINATIRQVAGAHSS